MAIKLIYRSETTIPVEVEGLTPDWACDKSLAEVERFEIFHGNRKLPLAEMFGVSGDPGDKRFDLEGNLAGVHWIGAHMRSGQILVHGPAGRHLGSEMRGGKIRVEGDAADWVGCEMRDGLIHILGDAGHLVGAAYRGAAKGMRGGAILVDGSAGNEVGLSMQQGTIAIGGDVGEMLGFNMNDGTLLVLGDCGLRAGAGMKGGAIALLGPTPPTLLSTFRFDRATTLDNMPPTPRGLSELGLPIDESRLPTDLDVYIGDQLADGTGEIYVRHPRAS